MSDQPASPPRQSQLTLSKLTVEVENFIDDLLPANTPQADYDRAVGEVIHTLLPFTIDGNSPS